MGVLAEHHRLGRIVLDIFFDIPRTGVHGAGDLGFGIRPAAIIRGRALVLHRTGGVNSLDRLVRGAEVVAEARFVAHRPDKNRRMVAEGLHHAHIALDVALLVILAVGERLLAVAVSVRLHVRLADDHDAFAVAEIVPHRIVRIVACAHRVHVEALHEPDILEHPFARYGVTSLGLHLVAVDALEKNALAVEIDDRILDFDAAEAERNGAVVDAAENPPSPLVLDRSHIDVRHFAVPEFRILDRTLLDDVAVFVDNLELADLVVFGKPGFDDEVLRSLLVLGYEIDRAENAGKAPEILIFEIGAVAVLVDFDLNGVFTEPFEIRRNIEFDRKAAVFGITDLLAVDADVKSRRNAVEMDDRAAQPPAPGTLERRFVEPYRIAVFEACKRLVRLAHRIGGGQGDRVFGVGVKRRIERPLKLPAAGNGDLRALLPVAGRFALPLEIPFAVQRDYPARLRFVALAAENVEG